MPIDYRGGTPEERIEALERRQRLAHVTIWTGVVAVLAGMVLFTAGLWALHRAGLF